MMGVGGGSENLRTLLLSGISGLIGGALSMAAGEYISVYSQKDAEESDIAKERAAQAHVRLRLLRPCALRMADPLPFLRCAPWCKLSVTSSQGTWLCCHEAVRVCPSMQSCRCHAACGYAVPHGFYLDSTYSVAFTRKLSRCCLKLIRYPLRRSTQRNQE